MWSRFWVSTTSKLALDCGVIKVPGHAVYFEDYYFPHCLSLEIFKSPVLVETTVPSLPASAISARLVQVTFLGDEAEGLTLDREKEESDSLQDFWR